VETNQNNANHHKVGPVYGGRGLDRYIGLDRRYIGVVICGATCDDIDEAIGVDIPWSIFDAQAWYLILLRNFLIEIISYCSDKICSSLSFIFSFNA
jgi:hypothetical protein